MALPDSAYLLVAASSFAFAACSGPAGDSTRIDAVTISPSAAVVGAGTKLRFEAAVTGNGTFSKAVTWSVQPEAGAGRITQDGWYEAPLDRATGVRIVATSVAQPAKRGFASVDVVTPSVAISPRAVETMLGETIQFVPVFEGGIATAVEWSCGYGTIDSSGSYRAPDYPWAAEDWVMVRAVASRGTDLAVVSLRLRPPTLSGTSGPAGPGDMLTVYGAVFEGDATLLMPSQAGDPVPVSGTTWPDRVVVQVPPGVVSGPLRAEVRALGFTPVVSDPIPFDRAPRLRLHVDKADLSAGESTRVQVAVLGAIATPPLTYHADAGSFRGDSYIAPNSVPQSGSANLYACVDGTTICSGATVVIRPFRVEPSPAAVQAGGSLTFSPQIAGLPITARFSMVGGGGTVTDAGAYTAPLDIAGAGQAWLAADDGTHTELVQLGIRGVPGLVARVADYVDSATDPTLGLPWGTGMSTVAARGNRLYVLGARMPATAHPDSMLRWIDVYDLGDPIRPAWLGAVESGSLYGSLLVWNDRLYLIDGPSWTVYDISGTLPRAVAHRSRPPAVGTLAVGAVTIDSRYLYALDSFDSGTGAAQVLIYDLTAGPLPPPRTVTLARAPDARTYQSSPSFAALDGWAYAAYETADGSWRLGAWDVSTDPPEFQGSVPVPFTWGITFAGPFILAGSCLYDRRAPVPASAGCMTFHWVNARALSGEGDRFVVSESARLEILDVSDPARPHVTATASVPGSSVLHGGFLYAAQGREGLAIYDMTAPGGPILGSVFGLPGLISFFNATAISNGYLYAAGYDRTLGGFVAAWDLATPTPTLASATPLASSGYALALGGDRLVVGRPDELEVRALDPNAPALISSSPIDVYSLALDGDVAWVATLGGDLVSMDLASPGGPAELGRLPLGALARDIEVLGPGRLALALHSASLDAGDLVVIDATDPSAPGLLASAGLSTPVFDIAMAGSTAFLATASGTVTVGLADPAHPAVLAVAPTPTDVMSFDQPLAASVAVHDGIAWVGIYGTNAALIGYDARAPGAPRAVMRTELYPSWAGSVLQLAFAGPRAFATVTRDTPIGEIHVLVEIDAFQPRNLVMTLTEPPSLPR